MKQELGLARYDAMCSAIAACYSVDEVKELRDRAKAFEVYAKQAQNTEAERKAAEIRIRAERRAGQLLKEMKENGQRAAQKDGPSCRVARQDKPAAPVVTAKATASSAAPSKPSPPPAKLSDLGITRDQSSKWQQLAAVPEHEFEEAISGDGPKPSTEGIILANRLKDNPQPPMDSDALWLWGRIRDFERGTILTRDPKKLLAAMTDSMRDDVARIFPRLLTWLQRIEHGTDHRAA